MRFASELAAAGSVPISISEAPEEKADKPALSLTRPKVTPNELILFSHQMASLTKAGISVARAVRGLSESTSNPYLGEVLEDVATNLESGTDVATSLRKHPRVFSELYGSVIHVGENTGKLFEAFKQIAGYLEVERETGKQIKSATRYPSFVIATIVIALGVINVFVIPAFKGVFDKYGAELPWQTQTLITISDFCVAFWPYLLALAVGVVFGIRRYLKTESGRYNWDKRKLRLPLVGTIFHRVMLARFCQTFAMVLRAGVPITQGLRVVSRALGNEYLSAQVDGMRTGIERGSSIIRVARESGMFTPVVLQMIAVGEETGALDDLLEQSAGFYEEEVEYELKGLTAAIEPILIICIGAMVLVLALGVFLPLWDLSSVAIK